MKTLIEKLGKLIKKIFKYVWIIIGFAIGVAFVQIFLPSPVTYVQKPYPVPDSAKTQGAVERYQKALDDTVATLWEKILGLKKRPPPTGTYGKVSPDPLPLEHPIVFTDSSRPEFLFSQPAIDVPILLEATRSKISILTRNSYNRVRGEPYIKTYEWPRVAKDFSFTLRETGAYDRLDGINLIQKRRWFEFDGFGIIAGYGFPPEYYVGVDGTIILWEKLEITPSLKSTPALGIEARWKF